MGTLVAVLLWVRHIFCLVSSSPCEINSSIIPILQMMKPGLREVKSFKHIIQLVRGRGRI